VRLYPLTKFRSKPAVPLAAKYRLIDIPLSNCITSGINRIYVLTQFMSVSLHRHIRQSYRFDQFSGGFVEVLAAQQTMEGGTDWYQGTADAVHKHIRYLSQPGIDYVLILSGDQLYRMDYHDMLRTHQQSGADATIAALPVTRQQASGLGIMRVDESGRVRGFVEKPRSDEELNSVRMDPNWFTAHGIESRGRDCLASMGIYIFNRQTLVDILESTDYQDFGKEIFPQSIDARRVQVHLFDGYWEDIGTIKAFYEANLSLVRPNPPFDLASADSPIYTRARYLPPSRLDGATVRGSLIAEGCQIGEGAMIENSVIGLRCIIGPGVTIRNSVLMGADYYESQTKRMADSNATHVPIGIGAGSLIEGAIIDKNCRIGRHVRIVNDSRIENGDENDACMIRDGIPIVIKESLLPDDWRLQ
jgi:glucose-1-phosphate adenylyltransferase